MRIGELLKSRLVVYGAVLVLAIVAGMAGWRLLAPGGGSRGTGTLVGGPFTLVDQQGETVSDRDFRGRLMLVYFGYTFCPDVCPMSLATMAQALDLLEPAAAERVVPIFITIDPERDTAEQLAGYAPLFHPRLVALTGSVAQVRQAAGAYRVYFAKVDEGGADDYLMDHVSFVFLMGPDGTYRRHFGPTATPEEIAGALREVLAEG